MRRRKKKKKKCFFLTPMGTRAGGREPLLIYGGIQLLARGQVAGEAVKERFFGADGPKRPSALLF